MKSLTPPFFLQWKEPNISIWGWSGCAVSYISRHRGVQLILAYSWARPARGQMFLFLLFLHFHSCSSFFPVPFFHLFYYLFYLFSPFLLEMTQNDPHGLTCHETPTQSKNISIQVQVLKFPRYTMFENRWSSFCPECCSSHSMWARFIDFIENPFCKMA